MNILDWFHQSGLQVLNHLTESDFPVLNCSRIQDWLRAELQSRDYQNVVVCLCKDQVLLKKVSVTLIELSLRAVWNLIELSL